MKMSDVPNMLVDLKLKPQECNGNYKFNGQLVMTRGFIIKFGNSSTDIAVLSVAKIITERVNSPEGADYLQVLSYKGITFWIIDDVDVVTILLPEDY
jgi:hypothetical protein